MKKLAQSVFKFVKRLTIAFVMLVLSVIALLIAVPTCVAVHYYRKCNLQESQMRNVHKLMNDNDSLRKTVSSLAETYRERYDMRMKLKLAEANVEVEKRIANLHQVMSASENSLKEKCDMLKNELNVVNNRHSTELKQIELKHVKEIERINALHDRKIADMNARQAMKDIETELAILKAKATKKKVSTEPEVRITRYNNTQSNWM